MTSRCSSRSATPPATGATSWPTRASRTPRWREVLNAHFVAVKVDREERPDIDAVYMEAVQLVNGSGGWPMTVLALPDGRPFWAGTYLPRTVLLRLLGQVADLWAGQRGPWRTTPPGCRRRSATAPSSRRHAAQPGRAPPGLDPPGRRRLRPSPGLGPYPGPVPATGLARGGRGPSSPLRPRMGRLWARPQVPPARSRSSCWPSTGGAPGSPSPWARCAADARRHELRGHLRPPRRGLRPVQHRPALVGAPLRKDALRQCPFGAGLYPGLAVDERARYRQVVDETVGYLLAHPSVSPKGPGPRPRTPTAKVRRAFLHVVVRRNRTGRRPAAAVVRGHRGRQLGRQEHPVATGLADIARPPEIEQARALLARAPALRARPGLDGKVLTEWNAMAVTALAYAGTALGRPGWVAAATIRPSCWSRSCAGRTGAGCVRGARGGPGAGTWPTPGTTPGW